MKLETERLILRDFVKEDWRRAFEYEADPLYLRYYEWTSYKQINPVQWMEIKD